MNAVIISVDVVDGRKAAILRCDSGRLVEPTAELVFGFPLNDEDCDRARYICENADEIYGASSLDFPHECGFTADDVKSLLTDIFGKRGWV